MLDLSEIDFSAPKTRAISIAGHRTSFTLEDNFWILLKDFSLLHNMSLAKMVRLIDEARLKAYSDKKDIAGLSVAIRAVLLDAVKQGILK